MQFGAFKSNADAAHQRWTELDKKYPKLLSGLTPKVSPKKTCLGTLYRLQVVGLERASRAHDLQGARPSHSCVVLKPT